MAAKHDALMGVDGWILFLGLSASDAPDYKFTGYNAG